MVPDTRRPRPRVAVGVALTAVLVATACDPQDDTGAADTGEQDQAPVSVTVPPERLTPFCQAMIDLGERLEAEPDADATALIVETYEGVLDQVPPEIAVEFGAVLADLRDGPTRTTTDTADTAEVTVTSVDDSTSVPQSDEFFDEGHLPDEEPALRVNEYVQFACRDAGNNPGPPPTEPALATPPST